MRWIFWMESTLHAITLCRITQWKKKKKTCKIPVNNSQEANEGSFQKLEVNFPSFVLGESKLCQN
ncbi:Uncharacterized protein BM_BM17501 [Brugia malayi]|uniref:Uncharacterized protein n=1 Tax=Brugia malayi TaxID=6279 RepID=A0A4E9FA47_BRUMA|nr:Uncharacterized protein BM_BM17501 [Brugia malayi]VIO93735.1 Uncharacterized protein BM_BM17501 [Brugia malayi]